MTPGRPAYEFRITKYDPARRDASGAYLDEDWTAHADIARGKVGKADYMAAEDAYVAAAQAVMLDAGVNELAVTDLEAARYTGPPVPGRITIDRLGAVLRPILREDYWARMSAPGAFVHIGYDFYMYFGAERVRPETLDAIEAGGLFVELCQSPHFEIKVDR